jgi:hypothetical protein
MDEYGDIRVEGGGTLYLLRPLNKRANQWLDANLELEGWQWHNGAAAVEHGFVINILEAMEADGLVVIRG